MATIIIRNSSHTSQQRAKQRAFVISDQPHQLDFSMDESGVQLGRKCEFTVIWKHSLLIHKRQRYECNYTYCSFEMSIWPSRTDAVTTRLVRMKTKWNCWRAHMQMWHYARSWDVGNWFKWLWCSIKTDPCWLKVPWVENNVRIGMDFCMHFLLKRMENKLDNC